MKEMNNQRTSAATPNVAGGDIKYEDPFFITASPTLNVIAQLP